MATTNATTTSSRPDPLEIVHHSRCADPKQTGCRCPAGWPRFRKDLHLTHRRSGNCWSGVRGGDVCTLHDEPRGECSVCGRCPACDAADEAQRYRLQKKGAQT